MTRDQRNQLSAQRSLLRQAGEFGEAVPLQLEILAWEKLHGSIKDHANAWNYLSTLYLGDGKYREAENAARQALLIYRAELHPSDEVLGAYNCVLARTLGAQAKFDEAIEVAIEGYR